MARKAYLTLENGRVFEGTGFGAAGVAVGEVVFTTGMTGYVETLTDKSYHGHIVLQTFPLVGGSGVATADFESEGLQPAAYVVKEICGAPSNFRSEGALPGYLERGGVVGLAGIDTRALTKLIREQGVMNGCVSSSPGAVGIEEIRSHRAAGAVEAVSCARRSLHPAAGAGPGANACRRRVALWDFGAKRSVISELQARGCDVELLPCGTAAAEIRALAPDGLVLSGGPGDPAANPGIVAEIRALVEGRAFGGRPIPIFGIGLGHLMLALAFGAKTDKLKYGHRGHNQPARDLFDGRVYITSQNHGYAVAAGSLDARHARVRFENANDGTCEGIDYIGYPAFSAQFHPEACAGPQDTAFLFDRFIAMI